MEHTILIVEDEKGIRETVTVFLKNQGYNVLQASNGEEGLALIEANEIHLAVVDIMMPVMDGMEATREIRTMNRSDASAVVIIAMTANAFAEDRKRAFDAGMNGHIAKPIDVEKLGAVILSVLKKQESLQTGKNNIRNGY